MSATSAEVVTVHLAVAPLARGLPEPEGWLSGSERARLAGMASARRREQFLAARWHARSLLALAAGGRPQDWALGAAEDAPPTVAARPHWHLSISHSGSWVAAAFGPQALGLDLEAPRRARDIEGLVQLCCSDGEQERARQLPPAVRAAWFHELWTVKESWLKTRGDWIAPARLRELDAQAAAAGPVRTWRGEGWWLALCAPPQLRLRWWSQAPQALGAWKVADARDACPVRPS